MSDETEASRDVLRGASDGLLIAIREVDARERAKRGVRPGDPGFDELARQVRLAAEAVLELAREEEARAEKTSGAHFAAHMPTIAASAPPHDLARILADWRAVERDLAEAEPATGEADRLMAEFERLRDQYRAELEALKKKG